MTFGKVGLAVDARGDVALAGHVFEEGGGFVDGRKDALVMKLASSDGSSIWTRCVLGLVVVTYLRGMITRPSKRTVHTWCRSSSWSHKIQD